MPSSERSLMLACHGAAEQYATMSIQATTVKSLCKRSVSLCIKVLCKTTTGRADDRRAVVHDHHFCVRVPAMGWQSKTTRDNEHPRNRSTSQNAALHSIIAEKKVLCENRDGHHLGGELAVGHLGPRLQVVLSEEATADESETIGTAHNSTSRSGSTIHSLHDPTYMRAPGNPACSMARTF